MSSSLAMAPLSDVLVPTKPTKDELTSPNVSQFQIPEDGRNYEIYLPVYSYVVGTYLIVIGKPFFTSLKWKGWKGDKGNANLRVPRGRFHSERPNKPPLDKSGQAYQPLQTRERWSEFTLQSSGFARPYGPFYKPSTKK